jgi:AraC-like DNA-binding protein
MLEFLFAEWARSDSLLANSIATRSFQDNLMLYLLLGLHHNHTARLQQQRAAAAPINVRRAEDFMRAKTSTPLTVVEIAEAAGCSVRALQVAFQRFRGTTPMAALRRIRLDQARAEMLRNGRSESIASIAAGYGFSTPSRFAQLFRRTYVSIHLRLCTGKVAVEIGLSGADLLLAAARIIAGRRQLLNIIDSIVKRRPGMLRTITDPRHLRQQRAARRSFVRIRQ